MSCFERDEEFLLKVSVRYKELFSDEFLSRWLKVDTTKSFEAASADIVKKVFNHRKD